MKRETTTRGTAIAGGVIAAHKTGDVQAREQYQNEFDAIGKSIQHVGNCRPMFFCVVQDDLWNLSCSGRRWRGISIQHIEKR